MVQALDLPSNITRRDGLRPLDILHDLNQVADLIEVCFAETMDADGREYLRGMRRMARDAHLARWALLVADQSRLPLSGYVWEENGRIVGNLSLIPVLDKGNRFYLVANVATHPRYRRQGIARALTEAALKYGRDRGCASTWLQVRAENEGAYNLYASLGFVERARRITWIYYPGQRAYLLESRAPVTPRYPSDWEHQEAWLKRMYPANLLWNLTLNLTNLGPGIWPGLMRFLNDEMIRHWAVRQDGELRGVLTWQATRTFSDSLWLAAPPRTPEWILQPLFRKAAAQIKTDKPMTLNLPSSLFEQEMQALGFTRHQTLVWMEALHPR